MIFASLCTIGWKIAGWETIPSIPWIDIFLRFVPIGLCFALSLWFGNAAYMYLSVAFIQMLKALTPVVVLLISFLFGLEKCNPTIACTIVLVSSGIIISCLTQEKFSIFGTILQLIAVICDAVRLCLINILLIPKGLKLSPIASLYYIAPITATCLVIPWTMLEASSVLKHSGLAIRKVGALMMFSNASLAFLLNLATIILIKNTSALTLNVSGIVKDLLLIAWSVTISGASITSTQYFGYTIAMIGIITYTRYKILINTPPSQENEEILPIKNPLTK